MFGALPVALLVKSPGVLALVSQASVAFVFFFAAVVAVLSLSPTQHNGMLQTLVHTIPTPYDLNDKLMSGLASLLCTHESLPIMYTR